MNECPLERVVDRIRVVIDGGRIKRPEYAVVQDNETDRAQERQPVLIQGEDADHHEEMEVHLDHATAETDQHRR